MRGQKLAISYRLLFWLLLSLLLLSLLPLLLLGRFAAPCADDFSYGAAAHAAYAETASLSRVLQAALIQTRDTYFGWQGSFSAVFLMSLQPAVFGLDAYAFTPLLMLGSLLAGTFCFCLALFSGQLGLPRSFSGCAAAVCALLCIQLLPSPVQAFYWYNGAIYYTFFHGLALLALALALRLLQKGGVGRQALLCLLALLLGGCNYVTALSCALLALSALGLLLLQKDRRWLRLLLPVLCLLLAFVLSMAAPGNAVRQAALTHTPNAAAAILASFRSGAQYALRWLRLPLLGAMVLLAALFWPLAGTSSCSFRYPALVSLYSYCLFSAMFCPGLYAMGEVGDLRLVNLLYYAYVLLLMLNLFYWLGWLAVKRGRARGAARAVQALPLLGASCLCALCLLLFLRSGGYSSWMALGAMRSGEAQAYRAAAAERFALLEAPGRQSVVLEPFPCRPYVLYMDDITPDPQDWRNQALAAYFGKDSVLLRSDS